jgi:putative membrane protein
MRNVFVSPALVLFAAAVTFAGCMHDGGHGATGSSGAGSVSGGDREFVMMAAQANAAEIATGDLAQRNAGSDAVRQYGRRMIQDHGMASKELEAIASKLGITPPKQPDPKHQADAQMLAKLNGAEFDRQYGAHMLKDHEMTIALFEKQSRAGDNAELKQFATKTLPILQEHLKLARMLPAS